MSEFHCPFKNDFAIIEYDRGILERKKVPLVHYQTFSDLMNEVKDLDGKITGENAKKLGEFYSYWGNYLEPTPAFMAFLAYLPGGIAKALYQITSSLEHVFNNMFKLFGLFGYLGDQKTVIGQFFYWFQILGTSLFTLILVVSSLEEAVSHIETHSTHHSDAIVTENAETAAYFTDQVDSAAVYVNASTRFTDGGQFGLGCEMGISTQKLHARGPMGLKELTSYKYVVAGDGQIRE